MNLTERFNAAQELAGRYVATDLRLKAISEAKRQLRRPSTQFADEADVVAYEQALTSFEQEYEAFDREQAALETWMREQREQETGLYYLLIGAPLPGTNQLNPEFEPEISIRTLGHHVYADEGEIILSPENQAKQELQLVTGSDYPEAAHILRSARQLLHSELGDSPSDDDNALLYFMAAQLMATVRLTQAVNRLSNNY